MPPEPISRSSANLSASLIMRVIIGEGDGSAEGGLCGRLSAFSQNETSKAVGWPRLRRLSPIFVPRRSSLGGSAAGETRRLKAESGGRKPVRAGRRNLLGGRPGLVLQAVEFPLAALVYADPGSGEDLRSPLVVEPGLEGHPRRLPGRRRLRHRDVIHILEGVQVLLLGPPLARAYLLLQSLGESGPRRVHPPVRLVDVHIVDGLLGLL